MYYIIWKIPFPLCLEIFHTKTYIMQYCWLFAMLANYPKISKSNNLKGEEIYFGSKFQMSQSVVTWLHYCVSDQTKKRGGIGRS